VSSWNLQPRGFEFKQTGAAALIVIVVKVFDVAIRLDDVTVFDIIVRGYVTVVFDLVIIGIYVINVTLPFYVYGRIIYVTRLYVSRRHDVIVVIGQANRRCA
jgi:hypothetical protein